MKKSTERILSTHAGSLLRPPDLLAMILAKEQGGAFDAGIYAGRVRSAVSFSASCEVDPRVVWTKLAALAEGARLATNEL